MLDAGISREDFLVAVSRARGATTAYGVAASELTDPELGPGTREIEDSAHELRAGAERSAGEFAAVEVAARKRLEAQPAFELIKRRTELERRLAGQKEPSPVRQRLDAVEQRLAGGNARLAELSAKREALSAERRPDRGELARIESTERLAFQQLGRLRDERDSLAVEVAIESRRPAGLSDAERSELALIGERLQQLRRREVAAERLQPSKLIEETLGDRPADPARAALWNEGVDLIYAFRHGHGIASRGGDPLGPKTGDAERRAAELRLDPYPTEPRPGAVAKRRAVHLYRALRQRPMPGRQPGATRAAWSHASRAGAAAWPPSRRARETRPSAEHRSSISFFTPSAIGCCARCACTPGAGRTQRMR